VLAIPVRWAFGGRARLRRCGDATRAALWRKGGEACAARTGRPVAGLPAQARLWARPPASPVPVQECRGRSARHRVSIAGTGTRRSGGTGETGPEPPGGMRGTGAKPARCLRGTGRSAGSAQHGGWPGWCCGRFRRSGGSAVLAPGAAGSSARRARRLAAYAASSFRSVTMTAIMPGLHAMRRPWTLPRTLYSPSAMREAVYSVAGSVWRGAVLATRVERDGACTPPDYAHPVPFGGPPRAE
jgi:hypothetical protein